jgi:hypothetical protein
MMRRRTTVRWILESSGFGATVGLAILVTLLFAWLVSGCPKPPTPGPVNPGGAGGAAYPEPGPVQPGNIEQCAAAARHADDVCPGSLSPTVQACSRAGGADSQLIPCVMAADGCPALRLCDPLAR